MATKWVLRLWAAAALSFFVISLIPSLQLPSVHHADLVIHGAVYIVLAGIPVAMVDELRIAIAMSIFLGFVGMAVEVAQSYVPGRTASELDAMANWVGIMLGMALGWAIKQHHARRADRQ